MQTYAIRSRGIIIDNEELLVVDHGHEPSFFALPGGGLEHGESPRECIARELTEELGITPQVGDLLYVNTFTHHHWGGATEFFFEILNASEYRDFESKERTHAHEIVRTAWISPDEDVLLLPEIFHTEFKRGEATNHTVRFLKG